ncbi:MAG: sigma-54-dependent transcriptional regulator [Bacillota bacterium]
MSKLILVVDDERGVRDALKDILSDYGYQVECATNGREGLQKIQELNPAVVLLDIRMPEMDGIAVLEIINRTGQQVPIILMTAYGSTQTTIEAMKLGAFDYLTKPLQINELVSVLRKAVEVKQLIDNQVGDTNGRQQELEGDVMIGMSPAMQNVYKTIGRVANSNASVLIRGESGTGKELVAKAIHYHSVRKDRPFVKINCASIPESLLESELFGYEKGAFTGATTSKPGKFELAHRGTLFLDEIAEMKASLQAKLLRVLQEREIERVGGTETIKIDVRIISATNQELEKCIEEGTFREDLYYRLNVVEITLPPLRERKEDIPALVQHIISYSNREYKKHVQGVAEDAMKMLMAYNCPGNIRELKNVCERAVLMSTGPLITPADLPRNLQKSSRQFGWLSDLAGSSFKEIMAEVEREVIIRALEENNWNRSAAAQALKMNRSSLYAKMKELGIIE